MISISTRSASEYFVVLEEKPDSDPERYSRRNSVRATLDGGGVGQDAGYSDTDRDIKFTADITDAQKAILTHMIQTYVLFNVSTKDGFFIGRFNQFHPGNGEAFFRFLITE